MTNKGLVYLIYQKTLEINKKMRNNPTEKYKWAKTKPNKKHRRLREKKKKTLQMANNIF